MCKRCEELSDEVLRHTWCAGSQGEDSLVVGYGTSLIRYQSDCSLGGAYVMQQIVTLYEHVYKCCEEQSDEVLRPAGGKHAVCWISR